MNNKLTVPARLEKAANDLKNNMTILKGCSPEVKEVIAMAAEQNCLTCYRKGDGIKSDGGYVIGDYLAIAYCLPDDIQIVVEPDNPQVPKWVSKKYTVCVVTPFKSNYFKINLPDNTGNEVFGLPAALHCDGWVFKGWLHEGNEFIQASPSMYRDSDDSFWNDMSECQDERGCSVSTAYASVWQKVGE